MAGWSWSWLLAGPSRLRLWSDFSQRSTDHSLGKKHCRQGHCYLVDRWVQMPIYQYWGVVFHLVENDLTEPHVWMRGESSLFQSSSIPPWRNSWRPDTSSKRMSLTIVILGLFLLKVSTAFSIFNRWGCFFRRRQLRTWRSSACLLHASRYFTAVSKKHFDFPRKISFVITPFSSRSLRGTLRSYHVLQSVVSENGSRIDCPKVLAFECFNGLSEYTQASMYKG